MVEKFTLLAYNVAGNTGGLAVAGKRYASRPVPVTLYAQGKLGREVWTFQNLIYLLQGELARLAAQSQDGEKKKGGQGA